MPKVPKLAQSEWKVMRVLWASDKPMPAYDIIQKLSATTDWQPKTIKTLLNRLLKKGAVRFKRYKNLYLYYPLLTEAACVKAESDSFVKRCFDGALEPMLAHFVQQRKLKPSEIQELKRILDVKESCN